MQAKSRKRVSAPKNFSEDALNLIAARFKALSEPSRLKLLIALKSGEKNVGELMEATGLNQANVSRQLQLLTGVGFLQRRRSGVSIIYSIADPAIFDMCQQVCGGIHLQLQSQVDAFSGAARAGSRR
jgi:DNA-binding transcriptional ArsR family regulator